MNRPPDPSIVRRFRPPIRHLLCYLASSSSPVLHRHPCILQSTSLSSELILNLIVLASTSDLPLIPDASYANLASVWPNSECPHEWFASRCRVSRTPPCSPKSLVVKLVTNIRDLPRHGNCEVQICQFVSDWGLSMRLLMTFHAEPLSGVYPLPIEDFHELKHCPVADNDVSRHLETQISPFFLSTLFHFFDSHPRLTESVHVYLNNSDISLYVVYLGIRSKKEPLQCVYVYEHGLIVKECICTLVEFNCQIIIHPVLSAASATLPNWTDWDCGWRLSIPFFVLKGFLIHHCIWQAVQLPSSCFVFHVGACLLLHYHSFNDLRVFHVGACLFLHYHVFNDLCLCPALSPLAFRGSVCQCKIYHVSHKIFRICYCSLDHHASMILMSGVIFVGLIVRFIHSCYDKSQSIILYCIVVVIMRCWICREYLYMMICRFTGFRTGSYCYGFLREGIIYDILGPFVAARDRLCHCWWCLSCCNILHHSCLISWITFFKNILVVMVSTPCPKRDIVTCATLDGLLSYGITAAVDIRGCWITPNRWFFSVAPITSEPPNNQGLWHSPPLICWSMMHRIEPETFKNTMSDTPKLFNWSVNYETSADGEWWISASLMKFHLFILFMDCMQNVNSCSESPCSSRAQTIGNNFAIYYLEYVMASEEQVARNPIGSSKACVQTALGLELIIELKIPLSWCYEICMMIHNVSPSWGGHYEQQSVIPFTMVLFVTIMNMKCIHITLFDSDMWSNLTVYKSIGKDLVTPMCWVRLTLFLRHMLSCGLHFHFC